MRLRPWIIVQHDEWGWSSIDDVFESKKSFLSGYKHVRSRKDARRELKSERILIRKQHKKSLNDLYTYLRPGSKINTCGNGNCIVDKVIATIDKRGYIVELEIPSVNRQNYTAPCSWTSGGGCVTIDWCTPILNESGVCIGSRRITEFGNKDFYY